jgi:hypothetical protein
MFVLFESPHDRPHGFGGGVHLFLCVYGMSFSIKVIRQALASNSSHGYPDRRLRPCEKTPRFLASTVVTSIKSADFE